MIRHDTPLRKRHETWTAAETERVARADAGDRPGAATGHRERVETTWLPYGPPDDAGVVQCEIPASYGSVEVEYATLRRGAGLVDEPHRGTIKLTGADRRDFLNRMITQELADFAPGMARPAFWLNRKGRIDADLLLVEAAEATWLDVDVHQTALTVQSLDSFLFAEEVAIEDVSEAWHRIGVHGPAAGAVLDALGASAPEIGHAVEVRVGEADLVIARRDLIAEPGFVVFVRKEHAEAWWDAALATATAERSVRPVGWFAMNIARVEAGQPIFNIDFGTSNLPHETGVLHDRVSFTKGCYLGQEVVARMESLGKPKQVIAGLLVDGDELPATGDQVFGAADGSIGDVVGVVTSSAPSPMLGARPVALAMVKSGFSAPGTRVGVTAEGHVTAATVVDTPFWRAAPAAGP